MKQAPLTWYSCFVVHLLISGFIKDKSDTSLFIYRHRTDRVYLLLYVDVVFLIASNQDLLRCIAINFRRNSPWRISISSITSSVWLFNSVLRAFFFHNDKTLDVSVRAGMTNCKLCNTPVGAHPKFSYTVSAPGDDPTLYLTFTRPDISYVVGVSPCMILVTFTYLLLNASQHYLQGTLGHNLLLPPSATSTLLVRTDP